MPADLPGYYFDAAKNRYFKVQANHVAPSGAPYSRQAIKAEKLIQKTKQQEAASRLSKDASTVKRSNLLRHPLLIFDRRLGNLQKNCVSSAAEYYAASLNENEVAMPGIRNCSGRFAVEEISGRLFAGVTAGPVVLTAGRQRTGQQTTSPHPADFSHEGGKWPNCPNEDPPGYLYAPPFFSALSLPINGLVLPATPVCTFCTYDDLTAERSTLYMTDYREQRLLSFNFPFLVLDLALSPSRSCLAIASRRGIHTVNDFSPYRYFNPRSRQRLHRRVHHTSIRSEQMVVEFKDEHVLMSGARTGKVMLCDTRSMPAQSTTRIQHSNAITGLAALSDGNRILVNGMAGMKIYDLRFAPSPSDVHRSQDSASNPHSKQIYHYGFEPTPSVLTFNIPPTRWQNHYGLGFAYDPELNIALCASSDGHQYHRVGLWSTVTGNMLKSPLNDYAFPRPVTCAQIVRARDGPKSILLAFDQKITEWCAQGRGLEGEQEL